MADTIDLANYKYTLTLDSSGYDSGMGKAQEVAETMKTKLDGVGNFLKTTFTAGLVAAGAAIAGTVTEGVKSYADLEEQMSKFQSTTGASAEQVSKVQDITKDLYKTNTDSMEDIVATSSAMMTQLGTTTDQIGALQQTVMDFAKTTGMANTDVVGAVDDIGDAWGLTAEQSVGYLDVLKKSSEEYGTDVSSVTSALAQAAPASKALGLSLDQTNGIMNMFAASGLDSSQAITALTYAAKTVKSPEEFQKMLADIQAISDPTARAQKAVELFGARAGVALSNAFDNNQSLQDFVLTTEDCTGAVSDASAAFDSNFNVQLELAKKQFSGLSMEIGQKLMPTINSILSWVTTNMPAITSAIQGAINFISGLITPFINGIKTLVSSFTSAGSEANSSFSKIKEAISSAITTVQGIIQSFVNLISIVWSQWGDKITTVVTTSFNAVLPIIQTALTLIKNVIDTVTALISGDWKGFFEGLKNTASSMFTLIKNVFTGAFSILQSTLSAAFTTMKNTAINLFNALWTGLKLIFANIQSWFQSSWNGIITWLTGLATRFYNAAVTIFTSLWNGLKSIWESISTWVSEVFDGVITTITGFATKFFDAGASIFNNLWEGIKSIWTGISKWVSEKVSWIADQLAFWKSAQATMSSGSSGSSSGVKVTVTTKSTKVNGSHANGLDYVPFDNYVALLHRGERVLTAAQNVAYTGNQSAGKNGDTVTLSIGDIHVHEADNVEQFAEAIMRQLPNALLQQRYKRR